MKRFYLELPEQYEEQYHINAKEKKTALIFNGFAMAITVAVALPVFWMADWSALRMDRLLWYDGVLLLAFVAYVLLHELTHGLVYKITTRHKLTFGLSWSCAYCGVPDGYVPRWVAIWSVAAPLVVYTLLFLPLTLWLASVEIGLYLIAGFMLAFHLGGCTGDLYLLWLLLFRFRNRKLLMRDTGPEQFIFLPKAE